MDNYHSAMIIQKQIIADRIKETRNQELVKALKAARTTESRPRASLKLTFARLFS